MKGFHLTKKQVSRLKSLHKKQKDRRMAYRVNAIILLGTGWSLTEVSEALLLDTETLRKYVQKYQEGKIEELLALHYKGRECRLTDEEKLELKSHLANHTYEDVKSILTYVRQRYGVTYKSTAMRNLLKALGFVYKKPKLVPNNSDPVATMQYLQAYEEMRRSGFPLYFMDGVHPQHNSRPSHGWILKGETKALLTNTGRKRLNINGAVNIDTKALVTHIGETVNAQSTIVLLKKILTRHKKDEKIYIVCDNAGYYRSRLVNEFLERNKKIELVFLPAYSPFLNLVERVWKYFNKMILYNKYYETFSDFKNACVGFFKKKHKRALDKRLVEKFHFSEKNISPLICAT